MIICVCANLNQEAIRQAIRSNEDSPAEVFAACGAPLDPENPRKNRCLKCVPQVRAEIAQKIIPIVPA